MAKKNDPRTTTKEIVDFCKMANSVEGAEIHMSACQEYINSAKNSIENLKNFLTFAEVDIYTAEECVIESEMRLQHIKAELQTLFSRTFYQKMDHLSSGTTQRDGQNTPSSIKSLDRVFSPEQVSLELEKYALENNIYLGNYGARYERHGDTIFISLQPRSTEDIPHDFHFHASHETKSRMLRNSETAEGALRIKVSHCVSSGTGYEGKQHQVKDIKSNCMEGGKPKSESFLKCSYGSKEPPTFFTSSANADLVNANVKTTTQSEGGETQLKTLAKRNFALREPEEVITDWCSSGLTVERLRKLEASFERESTKSSSVPSRESYNTCSDQLNFIKSKGKSCSQNNQALGKCIKSEYNLLQDSVYNASSDSELSRLAERMSIDRSKERRQRSESILVKIYSSDSEDECEVFPKQNERRKNDDDTKPQTKYCNSKSTDLIKMSSSSGPESIDLIKMSSSSSGGSENTCLLIGETNRESITNVETDANIESCDKDHSYCTKNSREERDFPVIPSICFPTDAGNTSCGKKTFSQSILNDCNYRPFPSEHFFNDDSNAQTSSDNKTDLTGVYSEQLYALGRSTSSNSALNCHSSKSKKHYCTQLKVKSKGLSGKCYSDELHTKKMACGLDVKCFSTPHSGTRRHTMTNETFPETLNQTFHLFSPLKSPENLPASPRKNVKPEQRNETREDGSSSDEASLNAIECEDINRSRTCSTSSSYTSFNEEIVRQMQESSEFEAASPCTTIDMQFDSKSDDPTPYDESNFPLNIDESESIYVHISEESINNRSAYTGLFSTFNCSSSFLRDNQTLDLSDSVQPFLTISDSFHDEQLQSEELSHGRKSEQFDSTENVSSNSFHNGQNLVCYHNSKPFTPRYYNHTPKPDYSP